MSHHLYWQMDQILNIRHLYNLLLFLVHMEQLFLHQSIKNQNLLDLVILYHHIRYILTMNHLYHQIVLHLIHHHKSLIRKIF